jgi:alkylated DNA nucleotide flippase Atl1
MVLKKSWKEKLFDDKDLPKVIDIDEGMSKRWGTGTCVIPAPREVDALMKNVPKGKVTTINEIRASLAKKHHATIGCPITTGIFASIAARSAAEDEALGMKHITPYWRTLKAGGVVNEKYPGGVEQLKKILESEGHTVIKKGKKYVVENYEAVLVRV